MKNKTKSIEQLLNNQTKTILVAVGQKMDQKIDNLAVLINTSFQTAKEHVDGKFNEVGGRLDKVEKDLKEVKEKVNGIDIKITDLNDNHEKIETRIEYIENVLNLPKQT